MKNIFTFLFISFISTSAFSQGGTWYNGDLHSHSTYSDGTSSVHDIISNAESKGFTFYVLTDHDNTYTSSPGSLLHWADTAYHSSKMILLYGDEWTTNNGHACIWNSSPYIYDSIFISNTLNDPALAAKLVKSQGGIFSINHPLNQALLWQYNYDFDFHSMEILNGPISYLLSNNDNVITDTWEPLLLSGKTITAVGGSDMHHLDDWFPSIYPNLGSPTTWVYSTQSTPVGIINGLKNGHVCISNSPTEPHLEFFADTSQNDSYDFMMGDQILDTNSVIKFKVNLLGVGSNLTFNVIKNGSLLYAQPFSISSLNPTVVFSDIPGQRSYYRIELLANNNPISWTNPIYFGYNMETHIIPTVLSDYSTVINQADIFPNPASDFIFIRNRTNEPIGINIINVYGEVVSAFQSNDDLTKVELRNLNKGIYFIKIFNFRFDGTFKVIKQ